MSLELKKVDEKSVMYGSTSTDAAKCTPPTRDQVQSSLLLKATVAILALVSVGGAFLCVSAFIPLTIPAIAITDWALLLVYGGGAGCGAWTYYKSGSLATELERLANEAQLYTEENEELGSMVVDIASANERIAQASDEMRSDLDSLEDKVAQFEGIYHDLINTIGKESETFGWLLDETVSITQGLVDAAKINLRAELLSLYYECAFFCQRNPHVHAHGAHSDDDEDAKDDVEQGLIGAAPADDGHRHQRYQSIDSEAGGHLHERQFDRIVSSLSKKTQNLMEEKGITFDKVSGSDNMIDLAEFQHMIDELLDETY